MSAFAIALVLAAPVPVPGREPDPPTVVAQARPAAELLDLFKAAAANNLNAGPAIAAVEGAVFEALGDKGLDGLDHKRPAAAYAYLAAVPAESWGVAVVPYTDEKAFLALLGRLKYEAEPVKERPGEHALTPGDTVVPLFRLPARVRFHDRYAYVAVNAPASALDPKNLLPVGKLIDPGEMGALAARLHLDRLDPAYTKLAMEQLDEWDRELGKGDPRAMTFAQLAAVAAPGLKGLRRLAAEALADGKLAAYRFILDPATGEQSHEIELTAKPGTPLAAAVAARTPTKNRFAGITPADAVLGGVAQLPTFAPEAREAVVAGVKLLAADAADAAEDFRPAVEQLRKALAKTAAAGRGDLGFALVGPDKDGRYTAVAAVELDDPAAVEKAVRAAVKTLPEDARKLAAFDAGKAGGLPVHTFAVGPFLPEWATKAVGDGPVKVAVGKDAVFFAAGPAADAELARVVALKPGAARALDVWVHAKKLPALLTALESPLAGPLGAALGGRDGLISGQFLDVRGGAALRVKFGSNTLRPAGGGSK